MIVGIGGYDCSDSLVYGVCGGGGSPSSGSTGVYSCVCVPVCDRRVGGVGDGGDDDCCCVVCSCVAVAVCMNDAGGVDIVRICSSVHPAVCEWSSVASNCSCACCRPARKYGGSGCVSCWSRKVRLRLRICCDSSCVSCLVGGGVVGAGWGLAGSSCIGGDVCCGCAL